MTCCVPLSEHKREPQPTSRTKTEQKTGIPENLLSTNIPEYKQLLLPTTRAGRRGWGTPRVRSFVAAPPCYQRARVGGREPHPTEARVRPRFCSFAHETAVPCRELPVLLVGAPGVSWTKGGWGGVGAHRAGSVGSSGEVCGSQQQARVGAWVQEGMQGQNETRGACTRRAGTS